MVVATTPMISMTVTTIAMIVAMSVATIAMVAQPREGWCAVIVTTEPRRTGATKYRTSKVDSVLTEVDITPEWLHGPQTYSPGPQCPPPCTSIAERFVERKIEGNRTFVHGHSPPFVTNWVIYHFFIEATNPTANPSTRVRVKG